MANARVLAFALAGIVGILVANSCSPFGGGRAFHCTDDLACSGGPGDGRCEPNGYCSFLDPACEGGRSYGSESGPLAGVCVGSEPPVDAQLFEDAPPIPVDAITPEAGETCYGAPNGYVRPCFAAPLTGQRSIAGDIDTDAGSSDCSDVVSNTTHCVIAAGRIVIGNGSTLRVTGDRPLVLVASEAIEIAGTLDASSRRSPARLGPDADPAGGCTPPQEAKERAGGAGGTLGGKGGNGGTADGERGGIAAEVVAITAVRGGCRGGAGKNRIGGMGGSGGAGGGAVYLIATTISVAGRINASGAGGGGGPAGVTGGGGGGSGGFIGLDAVTIANAGSIYANGGGGGEGSSNQSAGRPGGEATGVAAAPGGTGGSPGAAGGAGGAVTPAEPGDSSEDHGAGGGGGGAGIVRTFRGAVGGNVSPTPTTP